MAILCSGAGKVAATTVICEKWVQRLTKLKNERLENEGGFIRIHHKNAQLQKKQLSSNLNLNNVPPLRQRGGLF